VSFLVVGILLAQLTGAGLSYMLEAPEIRNYEAGRPIFDHPVTQSYAAIVKRQLAEKIERQSIIRRNLAQHFMITNLMLRSLGFLLDPINLALTVIFTLLACFAYRFCFRRSV
jgi:hypothetical protein